MNLTKRVAATAALLASLTAGVSAAILSDASSESADQSLATEHSPALTMSAFDNVRGSNALNVTSGAMLATAAPSESATATSLSLLSQTQKTVIIPVGLTFSQPKPRAKLPSYMQRTYGQPASETAASLR